MWGLWCYSIFGRKECEITEIYHQIKDVLGENTNLMEWLESVLRNFNEEWTNVHDEAWSGRPSVINDDPVWKIDEKLHDSAFWRISANCTNLLKMVRSAGCRHWQKVSMKNV